MIDNFFEFIDGKKTNGVGILGISVSTWMTLLGRMPQWVEILIYVICGLAMALRSALKKIENKEPITIPAPINIDELKQGMGEIIAVELANKQTGDIQQAVNAKVSEYLKKFASQLTAGEITSTPATQQPAESQPKLG